MQLYEDFIHRSRYARWLDDEGRRESWEETVDRYCKFWLSKDLIDGDTYDRLFEAIHNKEVMPSMRAMMTAGDALERDNIAGYNCAFVWVDKTMKFSELMHVLMNGTGQGFGVLKSHVQKLPEIPDEFFDTDTTITVPDSKVGWARAFKELLAMLYNGQVPRWNTENIRPKGSRLKTFGGRASGPEPLEELFRFCVETFKNAAGRRLKPIEVHDICCKVADIVVVGGVRRSALISLSDLDDRDMQQSKMGQWWINNPQRALANNSAFYYEKPDFDTFLQEWYSLYESKSGERGIYNLQASRNVVERNGRRDPDHLFGTNPCSEIILRDSEFCNLSEVIVRPNDVLATLKRKVEIATILGTLQSTLTDFKFLSKKWKQNCEEERLLGVSLTGIMDHPILNGCGLVEIERGLDGVAPAWFSDPMDLSEILEELKQHAISTNAKWATKLGINASVAITCVKPSGTVSQLCNTASGIHPRYSRYYIRNVRQDKKDPISQFLIDQGIPYQNAPESPDNMYVFSFPIQSPDNAVLRDDFNCLKQLELWKTYAEHWCEHKPSITVYYRPDEFLALGDWVYTNFDILSGVSFLPYSEHTYRAAPYEEISEERYKEEMAKMPEGINWDELAQYESDDNTIGSQELACAAGGCEI